MYSALFTIIKHTNIRKRELVVMEICPQTAAKTRPRGLYVVEPGLSHLVLHLSSASKA
jgi:hypothetical protein